MESKIKNIGILSLAKPEYGGIYQYTLSLLKALKLLEDKYNFFQIRNKSFPKILDKDIVVPDSLLNKFFKLKILIYFLVGVKIDSFKLHQKIKNLDFIISPIISLLPYHLDKPYIITIHDFQHEYYPNFFSLKERIYRKFIYKTAKWADIVICESKYVKQDIVRFLGISEGKIKVLPSPPPFDLLKIKFNIENFSKIRDKYKLPDKYLFYPAQFWYHKNHINLIKALFFIKSKYNLEVFLVLVGSKKNNFDNLMNIINDFKMQNQIKYLGYISYDDIPYLYKMATALVMPSLFESVSIPIWEAFYFGCPVVSSNVCALPEQIGEAGLLFDPTNTKDMADKIYRIWTDEELRKELVKRGYKRIKDFTIQNYAKQWQEIIEELISINKRKNT